MARGGMVTDKARNPDGTKSEFQKVESRASKTMGMHLNRAMASRTGFQRIADTLRYGTLHQGKSPFYGYDAIVSSRGKNMGFELSHIGGIHEGRAMKDMVDVLESTLKARGGAGARACPPRKMRWTARRCWMTLAAVARCCATWCGRDPSTRQDGSAVAAAPCAG